MPRISAEQLFKQSFPQAVAERHKTTGHETYFLVRKSRNEYMPSGDGKTRAAAWRDACVRLGLIKEQP
jgi:hypothetical protein